MLELDRAQVSYGKAVALHDISLSIAPGEVLALVGRNGAGKSTTLKALMGVMVLDRGQRRLSGQDVTGLSPDRLSRLGVAYVPENRQVFPGLSAEENLDAASLSHKPGPWTKAKVYDLFPRLHERRKALGTSLSGGEQQMLVIGRALITDPKMLLLDEPTEGLAPVIVDQIVSAISEIAASGTGVVLVEQNFQVPRRIASAFALLDSGRISRSGGADEITHDLETLLAGFAGH